MGTGSTRKLSVPSTQFFCEAKTALQKKGFFKELCTQCWRNHVRENNLFCLRKIGQQFIEMVNISQTAKVSVSQFL